MCLQRIERLIRAPRRADKYFTRRLIYLLILFMIFLLSFSSNRWIFSSEKYNYMGTTLTSRNQGLWEYCQSSSEGRCCAYINDIIGSHGHSIPAFVHATRTFMVFAFLTQLICLIYLFYKVFIAEGRNDFDFGKILVPVLCAFTGFFIFLSICIYGGRYKLSDWTSPYSLHWSFGLGVASLLLVPGVFFLDCFE